MNNNVKKLISDKRNSIIAIRNNRENKEKFLTEEILEKSKSESNSFNIFIFKSILKEAIIESKKRYYNNSYHFDELKLFDKKTNCYKKEIYSSDFCKASIIWNQDISSEPIISINVKAIDINDIDLVNKKTPDPDEVKTDEDIINKYISLIKKTIARSYIKAIINYNRNHKDSQIVILPYYWSIKRPLFASTFGSSQCEYCLLQLDDYERLGFEIGITGDRVIEMDIPVSKLEELVDNIKTSRNINYKINILDCIKPIEKALDNFNDRKKTKEDMDEICNKNFNLLSLIIYQKLIEAYEKCTDVYRDRFITIPLDALDDPSQEDNLTNSDLYKKYVETTPYNETNSTVVYVYYLYKYIPVYLKDLQALVKEINGTLTKEENKYNISVNTVKLEKLLINCDCTIIEDNEEKEEKTK
jgi:hypothetical protein